MARLPQPGSDKGTWGDILNDYLSQSHKGDGTLKDDVVTASSLAPNSVTSSALAPSAVTKTDVGLGAVDNTADTAKPISTAQQAALDAKADTSALAAKLNTADLDAQAASKITTDGTATQVALSAAFVRVGVTRVDVRNMPSWNPTGDKSAAFLEAEAVSGGAVDIFVPGGTHTVQGLKIRNGLSYHGEGQGVSVLALPASPTAHMFKTTGAFTLDKGGIYGIELDGGGDALGVNAPAFNGIDFSTLTLIDAFDIHDVFIHGFSKGVRGSEGGGLGNDRWLNLHNARIYDCLVGVQTNEHIQMEMVDFRANDVGTQGRINDFAWTGCKWAYNRVGVMADPTAPLGGSVSAGKFIGCLWYSNSELGVELTDGSQIIGGEVDGGSATAVGIRLSAASSTPRVLGVTFGQSSATDCLSDIEVTGLAGGDISECFHRKYTAGRVAVKVTTGDVRIRGNRYRLAGGAKAIDLGASPVFQMDISGNRAALNHADSRFLDHSAGYDGRIHENHLIVNNPLSGPALRLVANANNRASIRGNTARSQNTGSGVAYDVDVRNSGAFSGNESQGTLTTTINNRDATSAVSGNVGYKTRDAGTATITAAVTEILVTHTASATPAGHEKWAWPTSALGSSTKWWVGAALNATQFKIFVDVAPGSSITFGWAVEIID